MAGSRSIGVYTADNNIDFAIRGDESNFRATVGGVRLVAERTVSVPGLPAGVERRYVLAYLDSNPRIRRKFTVGSTTAIEELFGNSTLLAVVYPTSDDTAGTPEAWTITYYAGERASFVPGIGVADTGLTDGTA